MTGGAPHQKAQDSSLLIPHRVALKKLGKSEKLEVMV